MKKSRYKVQIGFLVGILVLIGVIAVSAANHDLPPCSWAGTVKVNNTDVNGTLVKPYDAFDYSSIADYSNPAYKLTSGLGYYTIDVYADEGTYVFFKVNNMPADQMPSLWNGTHMYAPFDLTATDADNDGYAKGFDGYAGNDNDCNDLNATINPDASEICDNKIDDNCDGLIDIMDPDCGGCPDNDRDGYYDKACGGNDCDDSNAAIKPGATEICNNKDDDCNGTIDNFIQSCYTGPEGTEGIGECHGGTKTCIAGSFGNCIGEVTPTTDIPNDGIDQDCNRVDPHSVTGTKDDVRTDGIERTIFDITVGGSSDLTRAFTDENNVIFLEGDETIITFNHNFSKSTLDIRNITINVTNSSGKGAIIITGLNLQSGQTKTVYMDDIDPTNKVCIKDVNNLASVSELITAACDSADEKLVTCDGTLQGDYTCTDLGNSYKIEGLTHSGIVESTYSPPVVTGGGGGGGGGIVTLACAESWTCTDWSPETCPPSGRQTRTCTDANNCGTEANKPNEVRTCFYYVAPKEEGFVAETTPPEAPPTVAPAETPPAPTGMIAITGAAIGTAYQERPLTMALLTLFILLIIGLFIYSHAKNLKQWPFHLKFEKKRYTALVIIVLIVFIALFIHFILLTYFG